MEDGRVGIVEQAVEPGTYRFWLSDDSFININNFFEPNPDPMLPPVPTNHSITLGNASNPVKFFDVDLNAEGHLLDSSSDFFPGTFEHNTSTPPHASCTNAGVTGAQVLVTLRFTGVHDGIADPVAGTIEFRPVAEVEFQLLTPPFDKCTTEPFLIETIGLINDPDGCGGSINEDTEFCVDLNEIFASALVIPTLPATCDSLPGYGTCLNDDFELGSSAETQLLLHGHTDPPIEK